MLVWHYGTALETWFRLSGLEYMTAYLFIGATPSTRLHELLKKGRYLE